jgi:hypothetical protein
MWRYTGLAKLGRRDASNKVFTILDVQVARRVFLVCDDFPA